MHRKIFNEVNGNNIVIIEDVGIYELLNADNWVLTLFSAIGLETMMLDKPMVTINLIGEEDKMVYAESGLIWEFIMKINL